MPNLNLILTTTQNFLMQELEQLREQLRTYLIRPPKKNIYTEEIALLMQSYQVQQSRLDLIASSWSENLWGYERGLIGLSVVATGVLVSSFSSAILVGSLFIGLSKLLTSHYHNDVARKERITKEIAATKKALDESLALINKHEIDFKETVTNLKQQNEKLAVDNAAIHQQTKNLTTENKRLHNLISIAEQSIGELKEQQEHFVNSTQILNTEVQNFLSSGCKESTHLHKLLRTLIQEFSENVKTLVSIKDKMLSTIKSWHEPQPEKPKEIDIAALAKQTNMIGAQIKKNSRPKEEAQNLEFEDHNIIKINQ